MSFDECDSVVLAGVPGPRHFHVGGDQAGISWAQLTPVVGVGNFVSAGVSFLHSSTVSTVTNLRSPTARLRDTAIAVLLCPGVSNYCTSSQAPSPSAPA